MKKIICRVVILSIITITILTSNSFVQASIWTEAQQWLTIGKDNSSLANNTNNAETEISELAGLLFGIGLGIALIVIAGLGISYFLATSSETKSAIKEKTIVVVIGMGVLLGSLTIWRIIIGVLSSST